MNSTALYVLLAIAIVVVNGKVGRKRQSPPSPGKPSIRQECNQREYVCVQPIAMRYFNYDQNEFLEIIRSTPASVICSDASEFFSCSTAVFAEPPCDAVDDNRAQRATANEIATHFCGPRLADVEANKNCFASQQFFVSGNQCVSTHIYRNWRNCSRDAFNDCIKGAIAQNSECGPAAPSLYDEALLGLEAISGERICPGNNGGTKHFNTLKQLLNWRF